jgi:hypothetical protein
MRTARPPDTAREGSNGWLVTRGFRGMQDRVRAFDLVRELTEMQIA